MTTGNLVIAALFGGLLFGAGAAWSVRGMQADIALSAQAAEFDTARDKAREDGIAEGLRQQKAVELIAEVGRVEDAKIDNRVRDSHAAADGVSVAATVLADTASCDPGVARRGASATRAARVLSDLLGESNRRATVLAETADRAIARGLRCEAAYQALRRE